MGWACSTYGERNGVDRVLVERHEGKRPLGIPWPRWEDNNKIELQEVDGRARTGLIWLRIVTGGGHLYMR